jgi:hypothetical protein
MSRHPLGAPADRRTAVGRPAAAADDRDDAGREQNRAEREDAEPQPEDETEPGADADVGADPVERSAFMTPTDQSPFSTGHSTARSPDPGADAAQKDRVAGGGGTVVPGRGVRSTENGSSSKSLTASRSTPRR